MFRIDHTTAAVALPTPDVLGTQGFFIKGNPAGGTPATVVTADWANTVQEELLYVIEQASLTPSKTDRTQLRQAIAAMIAATASGLSNILNYTAPTVALTSISNGSPGVLTNSSTLHLPENGSPIRLTTSGALPTGLAINTTYYVVNASGTTYNLAATKGGAAINTSSAGSGTHTQNSVHVKTGTFAIVEGWGAGGGGGGVSASAGLAAAGGGAGGYFRRLLLTSALGATETITIGAGGTPGTTAGTAGGTGGTTSFGAWASATGGAGGNGSTSPGTTVAGGNGGAGASGDLNLTGEGGIGGLSTSAASFQMAGAGGNSSLGGAGRGRAFGTDGNGIGFDGVKNSGSGGGGAVNNSAASFAGSNGGSGRVIVWQY